MDIEFPTDWIDCDVPNVEGDDGLADGAMDHLLEAGHGSAAACAILREMAAGDEG